MSSQSVQELQGLRTAIHRAAQRDRRARRKVQAWRLTPRMRLVALSVFVQSNFSEEAALAYMILHRTKNRKRKNGFDEETERLCEESPIRDWFLEASIDDLEKIGISPSTEKDMSIFQKAHHFLSEKYTSSWLQTQNNSEGKVVTAGQLADRFYSFLHGADQSTIAKATQLQHLQECHFERKAGKRGLKLTSGIRKWCASFKRRWNVRHGQMIERECMDSKEIEQKVGTRFRKHTDMASCSLNRY